MVTARAGSLVPAMTLARCLKATTLRSTHTFQLKDLLQIPVLCADQLVPPTLQSRRRRARTHLEVDASARLHNGLMHARAQMTLLVNEHCVAHCRGTDAGLARKMWCGYQGVLKEFSRSCQGVIKGCRWGFWSGMRKWMRKEEEECVKEIVRKHETMP